MTGHPINGDLASWRDLRADHDGKGLLLGNGLSMQMWGGFAYSSLYDQARRSAKALQPADLRLFSAYGTENFERALSLLNAAIVTALALGEPTDHLFARYGSIQASLVQAILEVHPELSDVPILARRILKDVMLEHRAVFSTSYDLTVYWAMACDDDFSGLKDCFWASQNGFDPRDAVIFGGIPVYWLHGGMHIVVMSGGYTRKIVRSPAESVLDQFGHPLDGDPHCRPLIVTEGSSRDKRRVIAENAYLSHAFHQLECFSEPVTVFGSSLGEQDQHLVDALNERPERSVAVSIKAPRGPGARLAIRATQAALRARLTTEELYFYDAGSHPLGVPLPRHSTFPLAPVSIP